MSIATPLTAGIEIARSFAATRSSPSSPSDQDAAAAIRHRELPEEQPGSARDPRFNRLSRPERTVRERTPRLDEGRSPSCGEICPRVGQDGRDSKAIRAGLAKTGLHTRAIPWLLQRHLQRGPDAHPCRQRERETRCRSPPGVSRAGV